MAIKIQMDNEEGWVKGPSEQYPAGVYVDCVLKSVAPNKNGNLKFGFTIGKGEFKGGTIYKTIGIKDMQGNHASVLTLLVAMGASEANARTTIKKGFDVEKLIGKKLAVWIGEQPDDPEAYAEIEPLPADAVETVAARFGYNGEGTAGGDGEKTTTAASKANGAASKTTVPTPETTAGDDADPLGLDG